jgi:DnaJ family protein C protein 3
MNSLRRADPYCIESLKLNPSSLHGLLYKANNLVESDDFEPGIQILSTAKEHHPGSNEVKSLLQKAQMLLKRSKQKDYYKVLGVDRRADDRTIKRAYRQLTKVHHPDKAMGQGVTKEEAEKKMASINEAYEVLSDPELRARFDRGDDPNDHESQGHPFQGSPFGFGPGGHPYFGGSGGRQFKFQGGGFPFG